MAGRAVVVGGSLGGLNAALWLADAGWDVEVLERSRSPLEGRGAGIVLHPATVRYLVEHGGADLDALSAPARWLRYLGDDGGVLHQSPCGFRFTSWTTLYRHLLDHLDRRRYRMGAEVVAVEAGEATSRAPAGEGIAAGAGAVSSPATTADGVVTATTAAGDRVSGDLLVAADGVASAVRALLLPEVRPRYAGYVGWRGTVGEAELSAETFGALHEAITYHLMPASHLLAYPIPNVDGTVTPGDRRLNWVWYRNVEDGDAIDDLMTGTDGRRHPLSLPPGAVRPRFLDELAEAATRLPTPLAEMVTGTAEPFVQLIVDVAVPRMVFGRICLLGDAAFALRPHAAVGTAKAAEDAWQLARGLREAGGDVGRALASWERSQLRLGRQVAARTCEAGNRSQFEGTWQIGEPLPFGLYGVGDSAFARP
ncbi:MAG: 2,6-dihydroxypyridine 3-monooxygenase [Actinomycetota bacterium]|nr:2,6-dihydroxypyridine 3-monooxygenase [Actinomycetota bacterium]